MGRQTSKGSFQLPAFRPPEACFFWQSERQFWLLTRETNIRCLPSLHPWFNWPWFDESPVRERESASGKLLLAF